MASCLGVTGACGSFKKRLTKRVIFCIIIFSNNFLAVPPTFYPQKTRLSAGL